MDPDLASLARCVGDIDSFARDHWGQRPMLRRRAGPFDDLLDVDAIEMQLVETARRPTFRLVRDGETLPVEDYTASIRIAGETIADAADLGRIAELVAAGATLVLQGLQRTWLPLARFCRSLERATSHAVQANAYLTPPGAAGLSRHADGHEVLVLQVTGSKGWDVDGPGTVELAAGDVLYLPAGTGHAATTQDHTSLHLTIGVLAETYRRAIHRAIDRAAPSIALDRPLPLGYARSEHRAALRAALDAARLATTEFLGDADAGGLAAAEIDRARRRRRPLWTGQLRSVLAALDDATRLRRRADNPARLATAPAEDGRLVLELVDRRLLLPPHTRPALDVVFDRDELAVRDLAGLDEESRAVLARRLVREGLLEVIPPSNPTG